MKNKITVKPRMSIKAHLSNGIMTIGRVTNDDQKLRGMEL
jgi:hypothetical protein